MNQEPNTITILNWDKYNPRTDSKKPSWFRIDNTLATGLHLYGLDAEQKWFVVFLLSLASQFNKGEVEANLDYFIHQSGVSREKIITTLIFLEAKETIKVSCKITLREMQSYLATDAKLPCEPRKETFHYGRTDGRTYTGDFDKSPPPANDHDQKLENGDDLPLLRNAIYDVYPRRGRGQNMARGPGMGKLKKINSREKLERIKKAVLNYAAAQKMNGNEGTRFTMQFRTFLSNWEEWENVEETQTKKKLLFGGKSCTANNDSIL